MLPRRNSYYYSQKSRSFCTTVETWLFRHNYSMLSALQEMTPTRNPLPRGDDYIGFWLSTDTKQVFGIVFRQARYTNKCTCCCLKSGRRYTFNLDKCWAQQILDQIANWKLDMCHLEVELDLARWLLIREHLDM